LHCVFRRGLVYEAVVGADHADGVSGADRAGSDDHHDGGGAQSIMMPIMAVEFVAAARS
jgi:hypothetical protein